MIDKAILEKDNIRKNISKMLDIIPIMEYNIHGI